MPNGPNKYKEDEFLDKALTYIKGTYDEHYGSVGGIQLMDLFHSNGEAISFCKNSIIKYIHRYGKKDGLNQKDLFKAIHYITILDHLSKDSSEVPNGKRVSNDAIMRMKEWNKLPDEVQTKRDL